MGAGVSLLLDDMREEFARFLATNPAGRFRMDAALAHVVTLAYRAGMEDGKAAASPARSVMDARSMVEEAVGHA